MIAYGHRGASEYAPENTMSSFYLACHMGANGLETDVRRTKDGVLVLFHDDTLARVMHREGALEDYTYAELLEMRVLHEGRHTEDIIVAFEDFLKYFSHMDLHFAIELKVAGIEAEVIALLERYRMREKTIVTSTTLEYLLNVKRIAPTWRTGYLLKVLDEDAIERFRASGGEQLCPRATLVTEERVREWHAQGWNVRAWGITDVQVMEYMCTCGVDGMTVNFPDMLIRYTMQHQGD